MKLQENIIDLDRYGYSKEIEHKRRNPYIYTFMCYNETGAKQFTIPNT